MTRAVPKPGPVGSVTGDHVRPQRRDSRRGPPPMVLPQAAPCVDDRHVLVRDNVQDVLFLMLLLPLLP